MVSDFIMYAGGPPTVLKASLLLVWFFLTRVAQLHAISSSLELLCIATNIPGEWLFTKNLVAAMRLDAASEDGLSDDLCEPTRTMGFGNPDKENAKADAVYCIVSVPCATMIPI